MGLRSRACAQSRTAEAAQDLSRLAGSLARSRIHSIQSLLCAESAERHPESRTSSRRSWMGCRSGSLIVGPFERAGGLARGVV